MGNHSDHKLFVIDGKFAVSIEKEKALLVSELFKHFTPMWADSCANDEDVETAICGVLNSIAVDFNAVDDMEFINILNPAATVNKDVSTEKANAPVEEEAESAEDATALEEDPIAETKARAKSTRGRKKTEKVDSIVEEPAPEPEPEMEQGPDSEPVPAEVEAPAVEVAPESSVKEDPTPVEEAI